MGSSHERIAALACACRHLPSHLSTLSRKLIHGNPDITRWLEIARVAGKKPILVVMIERLGDLIACSPLARQLKINHPDSVLAWICSARFAPVFDRNPWVDAVFHEEALASWLLSKRKLATPYYCYELFLDSQRCCWTGIKLPGRHSGISKKNYLDPGNNLLTAYGHAAGMADIINVEPDIFPSAAPFSLPSTLAYKPLMAIHFDSEDPDRRLGTQTAIAYAKQAIATGWGVIELGLHPVVSQAVGGVFFPGSEASLQEQFSLLDQCDHFSGVDSAFLHCANALKKPATVFIGKIRHFDHPTTFSGQHWREHWDCIYGAWDAKDCPSSVALAHLPALRLSK